MRPIKLTMSAFGPYSGEVVVDFASLGSTGLYLVCGDTGAGKTTIFDAVSFALFGSPSGQDRTARSLRSDFASAVTPTFVELEFEHRGQRYTIRRNPEYERPKLRGDGLTTQTADAELRMPEAAPITGTRDVDAAILELIGIDRSQFSQIVMIAQGDFRRLLSAGTKERAAILRKLFGTAPYDEFQKALKRRRDKLEDDSKTVRNRLLTLAPMISISDEAEVAEEGEEAGDAATSTRRERRDALGASEAPDAEDMLALIAEQDTADEAILGALAGEASAAAARVETLTTLLERAGQVRAAKASLEETVSKLAIARESVEAAKAELDECSKTEPRRKELSDSVTVLSRELESYAKLGRAREEVREAAQGVRDAEGDLQEAAGNLGAMRSELVEARKKAADLSQAPMELAEAKAAQETAAQSVRDAEEAVAGCAELARRKNALVELKKGAEQAEKHRSSLDETARAAVAALSELRSREASFSDASGAAARARALAEDLERRVDQARKDYRDLQARERAAQADERALAKAQDEYCAAREALESARGAYSRVQRAFMDAQAGILARDLVNGAPCPVCGSIEHPNPAVLADEAPAEEDVKNAEAVFNAASDAANARSNVASAARQKADGSAAELARLQEQVGTAEEVASLGKRLATQLDAAKADRSKAERALNELAELRELIKSAEKREKDSAAALDDARSSAEQASRAHAAAESALDQFIASLSTADASVASERLEQAKLVLEDTKEGCRAAQANEDARVASADRATSLEAEIAKAERRSNELRSRLESLRQALAQSTAKAESLAEGLSFEDEATASARLEDMRSELEDLVSAFEAARDNLSDRELALSKLEERANTLEAQISALDVDDSISADELESQLNLARARANELARQKAAAEQRREANRGIERQLEELGDRAATVNARFGELDSLAKTAGGTLVGKERITFETYLQARWFDRVLAAANRRLLVMTDGRYELVRHSGQRSGSGAAQSGLDLDVRDSFTGRPRAASSLSGGESFKASLALALGLSDVVQANAGGIELDTMFVDEGFGTLDEESLQLALRTLTELSGSNKLVGIISHVDELRTSIDRKIVVEAGRTGSTLRIEGAVA
ncbi:MAG: SMC family ATPase [Parolsenella sp.]|uniref:SMC family ATPase n=1 Tax=Parolsenella sp. TaxID=2083006 RepID=UPI002A74BA0C|nr:SMC family ATPase [Parolsenella sp.]MDY3292203.1 SMC family ATPase [Parolsenella sp.]